MRLAFCCDDPPLRGSARPYNQDRLIRLIAEQCETGPRSTKAARSAYGRDGKMNKICCRASVACLAKTCAEGTSNRSRCRDPRVCGKQSSSRRRGPIGRRIRNFSFITFEWRRLDRHGGEPVQIISHRLHFDQCFSVGLDCSDQSSTDKFIELRTADAGGNDRISNRQHEWSRTVCHGAPINPIDRERARAVGRGREFVTLASDFLDTRFR